MTWKMLVPVVIGSLALLVGCAEQGRVPVDREDPFISTTTDSKDVETVAQQMAREIVTVPQIANAQTPPTIAFAKVENRSSVPLDTKMFLEKIRTLLMKNTGGKIAFLNRDKAEEIYRERDMKRSGEVAGGPKKAVLGADYFLTGTVSAIDKGDGKWRSTFMRYEFNLTDAESSQLIWANEYEVKKVGKKGMFDQ